MKMDNETAQKNYSDALKELSWATSKSIKLEMDNGIVVDAVIYNWINEGNTYLSKLDNKILPSNQVRAIHANAEIDDLIRIYQSE